MSLQVQLEDAIGLSDLALLEMLEIVLKLAHRRLILADSVGEIAVF